MRRVVVAGRWPILQALLVGLLGCASSQGGGVSALDGCYYFEQDAGARDLALPWGVHLTREPLDTAAAASTEVRFVAATLRDRERTTDFPFGYWMPLEGDSVRVGYPGMGGLSLDLELLADGDLAGIARPVGDAGLGERPTTEVRLLHALCPEEG